MTISIYTLAAGYTVEELNSAVAAHIAAGRQPWNSPVVAQARGSTDIGICQPIISGSGITAYEVVSGKTRVALAEAVMVAIGKGMQPYGDLLVRKVLYAGRNEFCQAMIVGTPHEYDGGDSGGIPGATGVIDLNKARLIKVANGVIIGWT